MQLADDIDVSLSLAKEDEGERPIGRKAAKETRRESGTGQGWKKMVDSSEAIAIEIWRKNETLERAVDLEVMGKDTSMMEPEQKEFYAAEESNFAK